MHIRHSFSVRLFGQSLKRIGAALTHNPVDLSPTRVDTTAISPSKPPSLAQAADPAYSPPATNHPELLDQLQRNALLTRLAIDLQAALDQTTIGHSVLTAIGLHSDATATFVVVNPDDSIELAWSNSGGQPQPLSPEQARRLLEHGLAGWDWRDSSVMLANNAQAGFAAGAAEAAPDGSVMALPLAHGQASFGMLALSHPQPGHFSSQDLLLFQSVAAQAAVALSATCWKQAEGNQPERTTPEQASQFSHSRDPMHIIFDHLPDGLVLIDAEERILIANDAFCEDVLGVLPRSVIGRPYATIMQELQQGMQISIEPHPSILPMRRARCAGADGRQRQYEIDRYAVASGDAAEQVIERWRDITRQQEQQREQLHDEQLATMARLAANVVHDIGNPLQSVRSCIDLSREDATLAATTAEYLELASSELRRMSQILSQLRDLHRLPLNEANNE